MKEHRGNKQSIISINSSVILRAHVGNEKQHLMFHGQLTKRSFNVNTCSSPLIHTEIGSSFNYVLFLKKDNTISVHHTFGMKMTSCVKVVPNIRQLEVTPYNITTCLSRRRLRARPTALNTTTLYRHNPISRESFNASIFTCSDRHGADDDREMAVQATLTCKTYRSNCVTPVIYQKHLCCSISYYLIDHSSTLEVNCNTNRAKAS